MDTNRLRDRIEAIRGSCIEEYSEAQVRQCIVLPILNCLGWDTYDAKEVVPEFGAGGREHVDYALSRDGTPVVFVEAKKAGEKLQSHTEQLVRYAWQKAVSIAILTNGSDWSFYLPWEMRDWDKREFWSTNLRTADIDAISDRLIMYLSKEKVVSGEAAQAAKERLQGADIQEGLRQAWNALVEGPDPSLLDLVAQVTERKCQHKPDVETVKTFVAKNRLYLLLKPTGGGDVGDGDGGEGGGGGDNGGENKAWYYFEDRNGRRYILAFVNALGACSMRRFDEETGKFLGQPPNPKGNYQDKFSEYIRPEWRLGLNHQPNLAQTCKKRLPDWVLSELRPQIRGVRLSGQET